VVSVQWSVFSVQWSVFSRSWQPAFAPAHYPTYALADEVAVVSGQCSVFATSNQ